MKILVTGGGGFIGCAVIRHIIKNAQDSVINLDKLTYAGNLQNLIDVSKIANELNCHPEDTFGTGIRKTVQWYLDNQQWCNNVQDDSSQRERLGVTQ